MVQRTTVCHGAVPVLSVLALSSRFDGPSVPQPDDARRPTPFSTRSVESF